MRHLLIILLFVLCVVPDAGAQRTRGAVRQSLVQDGGEEILQVDMLSVPVMGCGGVESASDVIEMMMAGATAVQVGAANLKDPYACKNIIEQLPAEMERLGIERLSDIIGIVK